MTFVAYADGRIALAGRRVRCALGSAGVTAAAAKREGDGATPAGAWTMRRVFYRPDRRDPPVTGLPLAPLAPDDGWCNSPDNPAYNRLVRLPHPASAERLWRDDGVYDLIVELGDNDDPVVPAAGSAIFLHVAGPDYAPTQGCVALATVDLEELLRSAKPGDPLVVSPEPAP